MLILFQTILQEKKNQVCFLFNKVNKSGTLFRLICTSVTQMQENKIFLEGLQTEQENKPQAGVS